MSIQFPKNVSEYTREQCEEYLKAYPKGLNADNVRERLKTLTSVENRKGRNGAAERGPKHNGVNGAQNSSGKKQPESSGKKKPEKTVCPPSGPDIGSIIFKLLCCAGAMALVAFAAYKWHWIGVGAAGPMAAMACRTIWKEL